MAKIKTSSTRKAKKSKSPLRIKRTPLKDRRGIRQRHQTHPRNPLALQNTTPSPEAAADRRPWLHQRFAEICTRMRDVLEKFKQKQPQAYRTLVTSRSMETDHLLIDFLKQFRMKHARFEDAVWFCVYHVLRVCFEWNTAFQKFLVEKQRPDLLPLCETGVLLQHHLRDHRSLKTLRAIEELKTLYAEWSSEWGGDSPTTGDDGVLCRVLFCRVRNTHDGTGVVMNSLWYCETHKGLAVFNGLRHSPDAFCEACGIWNIVALKYSLTDSGHLVAAYNHAVVPMRDAGVGDERLNIRMSHFHNASGLRLLFPDAMWGRREEMQQQLRFVEKGTSVLYRPTGSDKLRPVPDSSWVLFYKPWGQAVAWIHLDALNLAKGQYVAVQEADRFHGLLEKLGTRSPLYAWHQDKEEHPDDIGW